VRREDVEFRSDGLRLAAWLYRPEGAPGPHPIVVLGHGFAATREAKLDVYAERFAAAGMAALAFDYRHFGDSEGEPRQLLEPSRETADWHAAIACARGLDAVDPERVALWGSSFGGGLVIRVAAADARLAAVVAQVPFVDGATMPLFQGPRQTVRLTAAALADEVGSRLGRPPRRIGVVGPPRALAAMTTPDSEPGYMAMFGPDADWINDVPARIVLRAPLFRPIRVARKVRCPLLVCAAEEDALAFCSRARKAAGLAPRGEFKAYSGGHFDVYQGELFERVVADQLGFLTTHLRPVG
jgi:alpha-beta hydrolase superfamily lysophospholipase